MKKISQDEFAEFLQDNQEKFYRLSYSYVRNENEAMDILQDAILRALQRLHTIRQPEYLKTWFYRVLVNESISYLRKKKTRGACINLEDAVLPAVWENETSVDAEWLMKMVERLPLDLKTVIFLRFYEDMKLSEISEITKTNLNTVKSRLYRALKMLRFEVTEDDV